MEADRLSNTIKLGTHYAMMLNSRDDSNQIIDNTGKQSEIKNIRRYSKDGFVIKVEKASLQELLGEFHDFILHCNSSNIP